MKKRTLKVKVQDAKDINATFDQLLGIVKKLTADTKTPIGDYVLIMIRKKVREVLMELNDKIGNDDPDSNEIVSR